MMGAMPRRLPAIAPRGPSTAAVAPSGEPVALPVDTGGEPVALPDTVDPLERVRALARQPSRYLTEPNPFTMALWSALAEPAGVVIARHAATMRATIEAHILPPDSDDPSERRASASALPASLTVLQAVTDAVAFRAMQGDQRAADMVAGRIEGLPGQRRGDVDPEEATQRARVRSTIEHLVREMSERAAERADTVLDVTPIPDSE